MGSGYQKFNTRPASWTSYGLEQNAEEAKRQAEIAERAEVARQAGTVYDRAPMVISDIEPYRSIRDGSMITSRSRHREHLRQHGLVEVGNEKLSERRSEALGDPAKDIKEAIEGKNREEAVGVARRATEAFGPQAIQEMTNGK